MTRRNANADTAVALRYHDATKHSEAKLRADAHYLDWPNQPRPFKIYRDIQSIALPSYSDILGCTTPPVLEASGAPVTGLSDLVSDERMPGLAVLARVLYLAAGITKRKRYPGGETYFRAYPNTGALYHIDLYLVTGDLPELPAGVYHFGPHDFALHRLRAGDYRAVLRDASGDHPRIAHAPAVLISTSTYWRNAWKYRARTYRHCFWDAGTLHANLLAIAEAELLQPTVVLGFVDASVGALLGLDTARESALTLVPLGYSKADIPLPPPMPTLTLQTEPLSPTEVDYPLIREIHAASCLESGAEAVTWRGSPREREREPAHGTVYPLSLGEKSQLPQRILTDVIRRRGSTRVFDRTRAISFDALSIVLDRATRGVAADALMLPGATMLDVYLIVHAVAGLVPGAYYYRRRDHALELLREGDFRAVAGRLDLGQELAADAAANIYSLCALSPVLGRFGNRGYRAAQLEGGITGGRIYLGAYALGFGATGLTFFDDEVTEFFSPHAAGKSVMFLTALGYADRVALGLARDETLD